jgi:hypothetical protein
LDRPPNPSKSPPNPDRFFGFHARADLRLHATWPECPTFLSQTTTDSLTFPPIGA